MKVHQDEENKDKETFGDLLYLFRFNGKLVFNKNAKLEEIQRIDISGFYIQYFIFELITGKFNLTFK